MRRADLVLLGLLVGCNAPPEAPPPAAPKAEAETTAVAPPALRAAWRTSVSHRAAHEALVENIPSLRSDEVRTQRLFGEAQVLVGLPIVADPAADAAAYAGVLRAQADRLGIEPPPSVEVRPTPAPPLPPARVRASEGIVYGEDQVLGHHTLSLGFRDRAQAERFVRGLGELDRLPILVRLTEADGVRVEGEVGFLRALEPCVIEADPVDPEAILRAAGGVAGAAAEATAAKLRANYAQVAALKAPLAEAYALEARLKLATSRFSAFTRFAERRAQSGWSALVSPTKTP